MVPQHVWTRRFVRREASFGVCDAGEAPVAHGAADFAAVAAEWCCRLYDPSVCGFCGAVGTGAWGGGAACIGGAELAGGCSSIQGRVDGGSAEYLRR